MLPALTPLPGSTGHGLKGGPPSVPTLLAHFSQGTVAHEARRAGQVSDGLLTPPHLGALAPRSSFTPLSLCFFQLGLNGLTYVVVVPSTS